MWIRGWLAWCGVLAVALLVLVGFHAGARPAGATHLCGNTGSSEGPFDLRAYEDGNWETTYSRTLVLAGLDKLFADVPGFDLPQLETGGRSAGSGQLTDPYIPPTLLKAIAWIESSWAQADYSVPYGAVGPVLVSHACAYGIAQVLSGMQNNTNVPTLEQAMIGGHYAFNIARGARIVAEKWNAAPTNRPIVGNRDRTIVENWYYAVWSYNGFSFKNHPQNPGFSLPRPVYRCDGTQPRSNYPYQELVFGCMANPPVVGGEALWNPVVVALPNLSQPAFSLNSWNSCSVDHDCAAMDLATPSPSHTDPTTTSLTRSQVIGSPALSVTPGSVTLFASADTRSNSASFTISNAGTGPLVWRLSPSVSWLKVSRIQGVSLGTDIGSRASTVTLHAGGLPPGVYVGQITIESLYAGGAPKHVGVTLEVSGAPCDFNGDGFGDLAIGVPGEDIGDVTDAGAVNVLYGSAAGLTAGGDQLWHQDEVGIRGVAEASDQFGFALDCGDFNGDGHDDLAIGVPGEDIGDITDAGAVNVLYGSGAGLTAGGDQLWHQARVGIRGGAEDGDMFSDSVAGGDFDGDGFDDLAIGVPGEDIGDITDAGAVNVLYGSGAGLTAGGDELWHQAMAEIRGGAEDGDLFGDSVASGDFDGDGFDDLAIGVPGEDIGDITDGGAVNVLYGSGAWLTATGDQLWHQDRVGVQGMAEAGDQLGFSLGKRSSD